MGQKLHDYARCCLYCVILQMEGTMGAASGVLHGELICQRYQKTLIECWLFV